MKYLYIFEDGTAAVHNDPTPTDLQCVRNGTLRIFRFVPNNPGREIQECNGFGSRPFEPVPKARITSDGKDNLFHEPEQNYDEELNHLEMGDSGDY